MPDVPLPDNSASGDIPLSLRPALMFDIYVLEQSALYTRYGDILDWARLRMALWHLVPYHRPCYRRRKRQVESFPISYRWC